jgi:hypothetical protein
MDIGRICDRVIRICFYLLFIITPFLFNPSTVMPSFELFEWNKMMFVYLITVIVGGAWIIKMIAVKKIIFNKTSLFWPLMFFLGVNIAATVFSIDPYLSFWGYYSRFHGGLLSTISYVFLYFAFVSNLRYLNLSHFLGFMLTSAFIVTSYGIAQRLGVDADKWVQDVQNRVFSTLGQPNWLAAYLAIVLPISISLFVKRMLKFNQQHFVREMTIPSKSPSRLLYALAQERHLFMFSIVSIFFYACLLFTKSRSGFLGFWAANALFWSLVLYISRGAGSLLKIFNVGSHLRLNSNLFKSFLILNSSFLILNFIFKTPFPQYNRIATIDIFNNQPPVEETQTPVGDTVINVGITDSSKIRKIVWQGAFEIIKNYPLFGTGPETFAFAY